MYDKILIPIDGSDGMEAVAEHASELAKCHDAEVHLIYVVDARAYTVIPEESADEVRTAVAEQGESVLDGGFCTRSIRHN